MSEAAILHAFKKVNMPVQTYVAFLTCLDYSYQGPPAHDYRRKCFKRVSFDDADILPPKLVTVIIRVLGYPPVDRSRTWYKFYTTNKQKDFTDDVSPIQWIHSFKTSKLKVIQF